MGVKESLSELHTKFELIFLGLFRGSYDNGIKDMFKSDRRATVIM